MNKIVSPPRTEIPGGPELDLAEVLARLGKYWFVVLACVVVGFLYGIHTLQTSTYLYSTTLKVIPAQSGPVQGGQSGGLGAVASLVGINLGGSVPAQPFDLYLQALQSREVAEELSGQQDLLRYLFAGEWDTVANAWREPPSQSRRVINWVRGALGLPIIPWQAPSGPRLQQFLEEAILVERTPLSPVVTIAFKASQPSFGIRFLGAVHAAADGFVRKRALERSTQYIRYLSDQLGIVNVAEHRLAIIQTLSEQERFRMMASSSAPYAAEPFDGPLSSLAPTTPVARLVLAIDIGAGLILGIVLALLISIRGNIPSAGRVIGSTRERKPDS